MQNGIKPKPRGSRVESTARGLVQLSLQHEDGEFMGAEDELLIRLGVSRPTLRQAAKIAENERLIAVRRGNKGGFYARRPSAADAVRSLASYLQLKGASLTHVMAVSALVGEEAVRLAAQCADPGQRERLRFLIAGIREGEPRKALIRREVHMFQLIAAMSGNPAIEVFTAIGYSFGLEEKTTLFDDPGQRVEMASLQRKLCEAILAGDPDIARLMMRRRAQALARWMSESKVANE